MIVNCAHPVPVRYVPYRGRNERVAYVRRTTPVEMRRLSESDFEDIDYRPPKGSLFKRSSGGDRVKLLFAREGQLWHRLVVFSDFEASNIRDAMPVDRFVQILEGEDPGLDDFGKHFAQTPLAALVRRAGAWHGRDMEIVTRGEPEPDGMALGRIVSDLQAPAEAALHALFSNEIALVGEHVIVRVAGPMFVHDTQSSTGQLRTTLFPRMFSSSGTPYPVHSDRPAFRHVARFSNDGIRSHALPDDVMLPMDLPGEDDIEIFAFETTRMLADDLMELVSIRSGERWTSEPFTVALADRLRDEAALSRIGALPPMSPGARLAGLLSDIETVSGFHREIPPTLSKAAGYITEYAFPRFGIVPGVAPEDEDAFAGLAP